MSERAHRIRADRGESLVDVLRSRAANDPRGAAYVHLVDGEEQAVEIDYGQLDARARAIAAALQERLGATAAGSRAILCYPHGLEFVAAFYGCLYAGVVAVPTSPPRTGRRAADVAAERTAAIALDAGAELLLTTGAFEDERAQRSADVPELGALGWLATDRVDSARADAWSPRRAEPLDLALLQYTSGSTGSPRGVMVGHANLMHNAELLAEALAHDERTRIVSWLPFHHDMGLVGMVVQALYVGAPCVLLSPAHFLARPARWLEAVTRWRATTTGGPSFAYELCAARVTDEERARLDLSTLVRAFNGSEPVRHDALERFAERFAPGGFRASALYPGYGLAEATLVVTGGPDGRGPVDLALDAEALRRDEVAPAGPARAARRVVGCGSALGGQDVAIVDPATSRRLGERAIGEIWIRGPSVAHGYWRKPADTRRVFQAELDAEGRAEGPYLRTGDLGFLDQGELYVTGRIKDVIILRGRNHHPHDLERTVERCHERVRPGGALAVALDDGIAERLAVFIEAGREPPALDELVASAQAALALEHEVAASFVVLLPPGALPRTSSGKLRRSTARERWLAAALPVLAEWRAPAPESGSTTVAPPETSAPEDLEIWLGALAASVLGIDAARVDAREPLAALGVDSLRLLQISHAAEASLGRPLPLERLLEGASLADLAAELASPARPDATARAAEPLPPGALSYGQRSLWFLSRLHLESSAYHVAAAFRVRSPLDGAAIGALERALSALADRHASLRTAIEAGDDGEPRARVDASIGIPLELVDAEGLGPDELAARLSAHARAPFDLARGPLLRAALFRGTSDVLLLAAHHVALDHWSLAVLLADLGRLCAREIQGGAPLPAPRATYADFVRAERERVAGPAGAAAWSYWKEKLSAGTPVLELPPDRRRPSASRSRATALRTELGADLVAAVLDHARERGTTPFAVCLAAFEVLLHRMTGEPRFLLGTLSSGRTRAEHAGLVGYCVDPRVLAADLAGDPSFDEALTRTRADVARSLAHDLPFALLVERLRPERDARRTPFVQVLFAWQHAHGALGALALGLPGARVDVGGLALESIELEETAAQFDVCLTLAELPPERGQARLAIALEIDRDLYDVATAERLLDAYVRLLTRAIDRPDAPVSAHALASPAEESRALALWRRPEPAGFRASLDTDVALCLAARARHEDERTALVCGPRRVSYAELDRRVERLARRLTAAGAGPEAVVAVLAERSVELAVALNAVLRAGAVYLPIDPAYPAARIRFLLADSRAVILLVERSLRDVAPEHACVLVLDEADAIAPDDAPPRALAAPAPEAAACLFYTSGSTGTPKGVVVPRRALAAHVHGSVGSLELGPDDRVLFMASIGFDLSLEETLPAWAAGAAVVVWPARAPPSIAELHALVHREGITVADLPTAYWHAWSAALDGESLPASLRLVVVGGERASPAALLRWRERVPARVRWMNSYGPTEATVTATTHVLPGDDASTQAPADAEIPIGRAVPGYRAGVLDAALRPAAIGVAGELAIGGAGLARGYLGDPRRTAERFVPCPDALLAPGERGARLYRSGDRARFRDDGALDFLGRADEQVKIRGFRAEPREVEAELLDHPGVAEAVVVARSGPGGPRLAAFAVPRPGHALDASALRAHLAHALPAFLVPAEIALLSALPRNASGKLDRSALPAGARSDGREGGRDREREGELPATEAERALAEIWTGLLGVERVLRDDGFFELGGDSIQSIQLAARAAQRGLALTPRDVFESPTLAALARVARPIARPARAAAPGPVPLTAIQRWFFEQRFPEPSHWNQSVLLAVDPTPRAEHLATALAALVSAHDALRLRFEPDGSGARIAADDGRGVPLLRFDLSTLDDPGRSAAIAREGERVQASLDIVRGPVLAAALFDLGRGRPARLLLAAHHLAVDAVSWRILADDLERHLAALESGRAPAAEPAPTSWRAWAEREDERSRSSDPRLDSWVLALPRPPARLRRASAVSTVADERVLVVRLDGSETERLSASSSRLFAGVDEILVAALGAALTETTQSAPAWLEVEGHGRDADDLDLARTVGWFTTVSPVAIAPSGNDPVSWLRAAKHALRELPARGAAWTRARYGNGADVAERLRGIPAPDVLVNYLGRIDGALGSSGRFALAAEPHGAPRAASATRGHEIEIDLWIEGGALTARFAYARGSAVVEGLAAQFLRAVRALIDPPADASAVSSADFPLARLSERELGKVLSRIDRSAQPGRTER